MQKYNSLLADIKKTVLEFLQDLKDNIFLKPDEKGDLMICEFYFQRLHPRDTMNHIINKVLPHEEEIKNRKASFFIKKKKEIFKDLPDERVDYFANLIESGEIGKENLLVLWSYFDTMIKIASDYRKIK